MNCCSRHIVDFMLWELHFTTVLVADEAHGIPDAVSRCGFSLLASGKAVRQDTSFRHQAITPMSQTEMLSISGSLLPRHFLTFVESLTPNGLSGGGRPGGGLPWGGADLGVADQACSQNSITALHRRLLSCFHNA